MTINIARYNNKPAGIYREIINRSQRPDTPFNQSRLVVGFSRKGPFNRPVLLNNIDESRNLFGSPDKLLEKRGSFFQRTLEMSLENGPVYALNLRNLDAQDLVEATDVSAKIGQEPSGDIEEISLRNLYNTDKFWFLEPDRLAPVGSGDSLIKFGNVSQRRFTVFMVKSDAEGFNLTADEWFGDNDEGRPAWMEDTDVVGDFHVRIVVVRGDYGPDRYQALAAHPVFGQFFEYDPTDPTKSGLRYQQLDNFIALTSVELIDEFEGSLIPGFRDQNGDDISVIGRINQVATSTGFLFHLDDDQFDSESTKPINFIGSTEDLSALDAIRVLSYKIGSDDADRQEVLDLFEPDESPASPPGDPFNTATRFYVEFAGVPESWESGESYFEGDLTENNGIFYIALNDHTSTVDDEPGAGINYTDEWEVFTGTINATPQIRTGDYVTSADGSGLVRVTSAQRWQEGMYVTEVRVDGAADISGDQVTKHTPINRLATHLEGFSLGGFTWSANHLPDGSWQSINERVLSVLSSGGVRQAIEDRKTNDFRYLVDSFSGGIETASKAIFTQICQNKQNMVALLNAPSMEEFRDSTNPSFIDDFGNLSTRLIREGGAEGSGTFRYTLPSEAQGGYFGAFFGPHLIVRDGNTEITVPPAGAISNLFVQKFVTAQPWTIIAGNEWTISTQGLAAVEFDLSDDDRLHFERLGVNPILFKRGVGITIEGNLTAKQTPKSSLSSINGIEVVIYLQDQLEAILSQYQWKFNTEQTRLEIKNLADAVCQRVQSANGIFDFENVMDRSNNTDEVIDNEIGVLNTYIEVSKGMRILVNPLTIFRTGAIAQGAVQTV